MREYTLSLNVILGYFFHELTTNIFSSFYLFYCAYFLDCGSAFCDSAHKFCVAVLNSYLSFGVDPDSVQSEKNVLAFHINIMCLPSNYYSVKNLLGIILLLLSLPSIHFCFVSWNVRFLMFCAPFFCSRIIVPMIFHCVCFQYLVLGVLTIFHLILAYQSICQTEVFRLVQIGD